MKTVEKNLSVSRAADLCGVARSTINYWIRTKKIQADRVGKKYTIPVMELILLYKSRGKSLPKALKEADSHEPIFRKMIPCWEFWKDTLHGNRCKGCVVSTHELPTCFSAKESSRFGCRSECAVCQYYQELYLPRIRFVHQIQYPAVVFKELQFWGGNSKWAELCEVKINELPGIGIEQIIHAESLETMISNIKKFKLAEPIPNSFDIYMKNRRQGKIMVSISLIPLVEPDGFLLICWNHS